MSQRRMTTHVEMGSIHTIDAMKIFDRCWKALDRRRSRSRAIGASRVATLPRASSATSATTRRNGATPAKPFSRTRRVKCSHRRFSPPQGLADCPEVGDAARQGGARARSRSVQLTHTLERSRLVPRKASAGPPCETRRTKAGYNQPLRRRLMEGCKSGLIG